MSKATTGVRRPMIRPPPSRKSRTGWAWPPDRRGQPLEPVFGCHASDEPNPILDAERVGQVLRACDRDRPPHDQGLVDLVGDSGEGFEEQVEPLLGDLEPSEVGDAGSRAVVSVKAPSSRPLATTDTLARG